MRRLYRKQISKKEAGFSLIEVMLASVVLTTGSIAFIKLQTIGIKSSFSYYARTEATNIAGNFIEQLRSNKGFIDLPATTRQGAIVGGSQSRVNAPQANSSCNTSASGATCTNAILNYQRYLTSQQMSNSFRSGQSLLCYRGDDNLLGYMRITYVWRDSMSTTKTALTANDCPSAFNTRYTDTNSVTIYAQL